MRKVTMPEETDPSSSRTYILRCWLERDPKGQHLTWRFSLKQVAEGGWLGFADFDALESFLRAQFTQHGAEDE